MATKTLPILHFNDVYRVHQKYVASPSPHPSAESSQKQDDDGSHPAGKKQQETISAAQFAQTLLSLREEWEDGKRKGEKEGLVLFSGDVFSPSVESTITRGSHLVPLFNEFKIDCSVTGNHDFDHSFAHLTKLIGDCNFPWLLSNIIDTGTDSTPPPLKQFVILERCGLKIGIVGLVEADWIATIPSFPPNFKHLPMAETAISLSKLLRGPEHNVDIIIALTHSRVSNDIKLANDVGAVKWREGEEIGHGIDLILGGHDHMYYVGKGIEEWKGHNRPATPAPGTEADERTLIVKSGTDFRDLSSFNLSLVQTPSSSTSPRKYTISSILSGTHHSITPSTPTNDRIESLIGSLLGEVNKTLEKPACWTLTKWDCRSEIVRMEETAFTDWTADVMMHAYAESLESNGGQADIALNCGGTIRGDSVYGPGLVTLGDILEILPFEDPVVVIEMDGSQIWDTMESALSKWPNQEGRFPIVAGLQVVWDSRLPPNQRVKSIDLVSHHKPRVPKPKHTDSSHSSGTHTPRPRPNDPSHSTFTPSNDDSDSSSSDESEAEDLLSSHVKTTDTSGRPISFSLLEDGTKISIRRKKAAFLEPIKREKGGRMYRVVTRDYMAQGYDGYEAMKGSRYIVDDENGMLFSSLLRNFLLGSSYIWKKRRLLAAQQAQQADEAEANSTTAPPSTSSTSMTSSPSVHLDQRTDRIIQGRRSKQGKIRSEGGGAGVVEAAAMSSSVSNGWKNIRDCLRVSRKEHMSEVDPFEGENLRRGLPCTGSSCSLASSPSALNQSHDRLPSSASAASNGSGDGATFALGSGFKGVGDDVAVVAPVVDGRLRDLARG